MLENLHSCIQQPDQTLPDYSENLESWCKVASETHPDLTVSSSSSLHDAIKRCMKKIKKTLNYDNVIESAKDIPCMGNKLMVTLLITNADKH